MSQQQKTVNEKNDDSYKKSSDVEELRKSVDIDSRTHRDGDNINSTSDKIPVNCKK